MSWSRSGTELRRRCRNLRCTKPRGTSAGYGYLIKLVAARLRGIKKRTRRAALGTTANWAFLVLPPLDPERTTLDDPFALAQRREVSSPGLGAFELAKIGEELQFGGGVHGFETLQEQAAKQAREHADGKKEAVPTGDPALAVRR